MLKKCSSYFKKIDLFGKALVFEEEESQKHITKGGLLMTFLLLVVCAVIGYMFGKEIYERKNPLLIASDEAINYSRIYTKDYPIFFSFGLANGTGIKNIDEIFDINITHFHVDNNLLTSNQFYSGLTKRCNSSVFSDIYKPKVDELYKINEYDPSGRELYCLHKDGLFFQNGYTDRNSTLIGVRFIKCNPNKRKCHENLDHIIKEMYIVLLTYDSFIDPYNYTHPIVYYTKVFTQQINDLFTKRVFVNTEIGLFKKHKKAGFWKMLKK